MQNVDCCVTAAMYHVYLLPTPNLSAHGECLLKVSMRDIGLYDRSDSKKVITRWPLSSLRRFGREGSKFTIESGRSQNLVDCLHRVTFTIVGM